MSKPKYVAIVGTISERRSLRDPANRSIWFFEKGENFTLDLAQRFFDANVEAIGAPVRVRYQLMSFKSIRKLVALADRKGLNALGLPPLTGWHGPLRLAPNA